MASRPDLLIALENPFAVEDWNHIHYSMNLYSDLGVELSAKVFWLRFVFDELLEQFGPSVTKFTIGLRASIAAIQLEKVFNRKLVHSDTYDPRWKYSYSDLLKMLGYVKLGMSPDKYTPETTFAAKLLLKNFPTFTFLRSFVTSE